MRIDLPGGASAELRDKPTVAGRELLREEGTEMFALLQQRFPGLQDVKGVEDINIAEFDGEMMRSFHRFNRASVVALLQSWTIPGPLPTMETIGDLDIDIYDALTTAVAPLTLKAMVGNQFTPAEAADENSPTVPSSDSDGRGPDQTAPTTSLPVGSSPNTTSTASVA